MLILSALRDSAPLWVYGINVSWCLGDSADELGRVALIVLRFCMSMLVKSFVHCVRSGHR